MKNTEHGSEQKYPNCGQVVGRSLDPIVRPCRHRHTWLLASGLIEWCYECGAVRKMQRILNTNSVCPLGRWAKPVGQGGENPYRAEFDGPNPSGDARTRTATTHRSEE